MAPLSKLMEVLDGCSVGKFAEQRRGFRALQQFNATDLVDLVTDLILCQLRHLDR